MMRSVHEVESGAFTFTNGFFAFEGTTIGGKAHGHGTLTLGDGTTLNGVFHNGDLNGTGCKRWADGSWYAGEFLKGEMHGTGRYVRMADGTDYRGEFQYGAKEGQGRQIELKTRQIYQGSFHNGYYQGDGALLVFPPGVPVDVEALPLEVLASVQQRELALDASAMQPPNSGRRGTTDSSVVEASLTAPPHVPSFVVSTVDRAMLRLKRPAPSSSVTTAADRRSPVSGGNSPLADSGMSGGTGPLTTLIGGPFVRGKLHGDCVTARCANGDIYEGPAEAGEWSGFGDFLACTAAGGPLIRYKGLFSNSRRSEVPTDVVIQDIYHASVGSLCSQLHQNDGYVTCTSSVQVVLQQVTRHTVTQKVAAQPEIRKLSKTPAPKKAAAALEAPPVPEQWTTVEVLHPCTGESGRPVRAQLFKLNTPLTAAQKANKRVPRDATKALFATEPLTPRSDMGGGSQDSGSPRTPGTVLEASSPRSPTVTDGRRSPEISSRLTPAGSKVGKYAKGKSASGSKPGSMLHFPLDAGRPLLQMIMQDGALAIKVAPLCRESGDYLLKIEVYSGDGIRLAPGDNASTAPFGPHIILVPLHVVR